MPYGIKPASGIFQKLIESRLKGIPFVVVKIDDILISGRNVVEHIANLEKVLMVLEEMGVTVKVEKCAFFEEEVEYNGFIRWDYGKKRTTAKIHETCIFQIMMVDGESKRKYQKKNMLCSQFGPILAQNPPFPKIFYVD